SRRCGHAAAYRHRRGGEWLSRTDIRCGKIRSTVAGNRVNVARNPALLQSMSLRLPILTRRSAVRAPIVAPLLILLLFVGCATREPAPVEDRAARPPPNAATGIPTSPPAPTAAETEARPQTYTVKRGDTLHQIALDNGLDYRELAAWNNLENPNVIRVGQVLRLAPPGESAAAPATAATGVTTAPLRAPPPVVAEAKPAAAAPPGAAARSGDNVKSSPKALKEPYSEHAMREVAAASAAASTA